VAWTDDGDRLLGVVGDGVETGLLETVELLLRAEPELHVVFAGEAARLVRQRRTAVTVRAWPQSMASRVHATAKVNWQLLARVDAVLDVSTPAASPRAAVAAAAAGRTVVAVAHHPAADLVHHGVTGVVVPAPDPARMAAAVRDLLGSATRLGELGAAARERWSSTHSPTARADRLADVYDTVAAAPS
jgi:glycosyltransferase involved in cell wall biosynthesis